MLYTCNNLNSTATELVKNEFGVTKSSFKKLFTREDCVFWGGDFENSKQNFDNIFTSMRSIFEVATTEGWLVISYSCIDATGIDTAPVEDWNEVFTSTFPLRSSFFSATKNPNHFFFVGSIHFLCRLYVFLFIFSSGFIFLLRCGLFWYKTVSYMPYLTHKYYFKNTSKALFMV